jgi:hypothetical protein
MDAAPFAGRVSASAPKPAQAERRVSVTSCVAGAGRSQGRSEERQGAPGTLRTEDEQPYVRCFLRGRVYDAATSELCIEGGEWLSTPSTHRYQLRSFHMRPRRAYRRGPRARSAPRPRCGARAHPLPRVLSGAGTARHVSNSSQIQERGDAYRTPVETANRRQRVGDPVGTGQPIVRRPHPIALLRFVRPAEFRRPGAVSSGYHPGGTLQ